MKKYKLLITFICVFFVGVLNVNADNSGYTDNDMVLYDIFRGEHENAKGYFEGNYITLCEYESESNETVGLYYSLKDGNRGIYYIDVIKRGDVSGNISSDLINFIKGTNKKIAGNVIFSEYSSPINIIDATTAYKMEFKNTNKDYRYLFIKDEDTIINNILKTGNCPYYATYYASNKNNQNISTYRLNGFSSSKSADIKNFTKTEYTLTESLSTKMEEATKAAKKKFGTLQEARTYDENGQITAINTDKLAGEIYQDAYDACMVDNTITNMTEAQIVEKLSEVITPHVEKISKLVEDEWKNKLIDTTNRRVVISEMSLPYIITGKDLCKYNAATRKYTCSVNSKFISDVNTLVNEAHTIAVAACITDKKVMADNAKKEIERQCETGEIDEETCNKKLEEIETIIDDGNSHYEENKDKDIGEIFESYKYEIVEESEKPKGCDIFGESTTKLIKWAYSIIKYGAPILAIIMGILDFAKAFLSGEEKAFKESWQKFIKRVIAAVVVILLPILIVFILNLSGVLEQYGIEEGEIFCIIE